MVQQPTGIVTFLFTDIEGSTKRWESHPQAMSAALSRHDAILRTAITCEDGYIFKTVGDAFFATFHTALQAVRAALAAQFSLLSEPWPEEIVQVRVRMAMHVGAADERDGDYFGQPVNRVARLLSAAHGGQILLSMPAYELVRDVLPVGARLQDLGEHRLKDLFRPEHVFQLTAPGLPSDFPPLNTLDNRPNNLPVQPTPLIGREAEIAALDRLLTREDTRLLTLTGPGGTGKTRLALQVAADLLDSFEDGVWFVNLAPISDPGLVTSTIAQTLGVRETTGTPLLDSLKRYLLERNLLLLLDNFEQVLEAASQVSDLLSTVPHLKIIVTSRSRLQVRGEKEHEVPALSLPDPGRISSPAQLSQYEAVRLFIDRAKDIKSDFDVTSENAPAVAEICARLDGLPLAIELAAARIKILPPQAMLSRLQNRLRVLTSGSRDVPSRQQTLRGAIEWSYDLLSPEEQLFFRRLAAFQGGRSLDALESVCNAIGDLGLDILDGVQSLVDKSLLKQEEGLGGEPRFVMLETIHEYARDKLDESGEAEDIRAHHARYFVTLANKAAGHLRGKDQTEWLARLEEEHDNFRTALRWLLNSGRTDESLQLAATLSLFWQVRSHYKEGRTWLEEGLAADGSLTPGTRARALEAIGRLAEWQGDYPAAEERLEESLHLFRELGDRASAIGALISLGNRAHHQNETEQARTLFAEGLAIARELGDQGRTADLLSNLGIIEFELGNNDGALTMYQESLALRRRIGDRRGTAIALVNLGELERLLGNYDAAYSYYEEGLKIARDLGDRWGEGLILQNMGSVAVRRGDYTTATALLKRTLALQLELGNKRDTASCLAALAAATSALGQSERAAILFGAAQSLLDTLSSHLDPADKRDYEQNLASARGRIDPAVWEAAWNRGRALLPDQAMAYALEDIP